MRARSQAIKTAAFAVSCTVAGILRKLDSAICAIASSFVMFSRVPKNCIVSWMERLSILASVRRQTTLTPKRANFEGQIFGEILDFAKCRANRGGTG